MKYFKWDKNVEIVNIIFVFVYEYATIQSFYLILMYFF